MLRKCMTYGVLCTARGLGHHCKRLIHNLNSDGEVRVRFAPSPTGQLHLGGLRTALYNYLFARSRNGKFILRIEDTDQTRLVPGATEKLVDMLEWSGIQIDEGPQVRGEYGPYTQSQRLNHYSEMIQLLLQNGSAYHCFCSQRRLDLLRKDMLRRRETPKYDNKCRDLPQRGIEEKLKKNTSHCVRLKLEDMSDPWQDMIYGPITRNVAELEGDPILMKSDGFPTYHFANVVDDHLMKITHVLRGVEWQVSTTKHLLLYKAFGWNPPKFGHLPLLLNQDGSKLSKRQDDLHVERLREKGFFPEAVLNLLCPRGLLFKGVETAGLSMQELVKHFNIYGMGTNSVKLDLTKIGELNKRHLVQKLEDVTQRKQLVQLLQEKIKDKFKHCDTAAGTQEIEKHLTWAARERISVLDDLLVPNFAFLWSLPSRDHFCNLSAISDHVTLSEIVTETASMVTVIPEEDFTDKKLTDKLRTFATEHKVKFPQYMKFLRTVISGLTEGPPVGEMMSILGKQSCVRRLNVALQHLK